MSSKTPKLALALLATSALGVTALEIGAERVARNGLQHFVATHPGVTVASIEASPLSGHVTLFGVAAVSGSTRVSIGTLRLPVARPQIDLIGSATASPFDDAPAAKPDDAKPDDAKPDDAKPDDTKPDAAPAAPEAAAPSGGGTASAENVVITSGTTTFHIKRIELAGTPLSNDELAAILDPKSADSLADRMKKLTAASIIIPEISADDVDVDHEQHWTEHQVLLANVVAGRVAAGSAAGMSIAMKDPKSVSNGTLGAIDASGIDLAQLVRVFGTKRTDDSEPQVPLMDSVTIDGGQITDVKKGSTVSFGTIKETGFKGRPLKTDPSQASGDNSEQSKQAADDIFRSFSIASFSAVNFAFQDDTSKDKASLASLSIQDFGDSKVAGIKASNFQYSGESAKVSIGSMVIGAFAIPKSAAPQAGDDSTAATQAGLGQTDFNDISVDATQAASDPAGTSTRVKFDIKHVGFAADAANADAPRQGSVTLDNLTLDVPPGSSAQPLIDMGYSHLDISGKSSSVYDKAAQTLSVKEFTVSGVDMGAVSLGFDLGNVSPSVFSSDTAAVKVAALAVLLKGLDLKVSNAGLVDKAIVWQAKNDGVTPAQERDKLIANVTTTLPTAIGNGANARAIGAAVGAFLAAPKNLHISASSKTGLGMADMALIGTPDVLLNSLDVKASANE